MLARVSSYLLTMPDDPTHSPEKSTADASPVFSFAEAHLLHSPICDRYLARTPQSGDAYRRACRSLAGGTSRQTGHWFPYPLTLTRGNGWQIWDLDGHEYLDLINNYTALVHGHAYPPATEIVAARVPRGTVWSANNLDQVELAETLVARVSSVARVRFTNSGSEAAGLALQIARAATGRSKLLMARFGYHGVIHEFQLGSTNQPGHNTCVARFNDVASFREQLDAHGRDIAAVFLEPMLGAGGVLCATAEFIGELLQASRAVGAVFVLDEVQTFRMATGGLQQVLGVTPDLTLFGKFIGGGFPVGAVGGSERLMQLFDPAALKVYHSGTFNGNPISMAAGNITVRDLTAERIAHMEGLARRFRQGLLDAAARVGLPLAVNHLGSLLNVFFMEKPPETTWTRTDQETMARFHLAALNHGLFFAHRGFFSLSTVMTDAVIDEAIARAQAAMKDVAAEL
jgi:glutamate-1-semialdehyde 2,1-aminomutase